MAFALKLPRSAFIVTNLPKARGSPPGSASSAHHRTSEFLPPISCATSSTLHWPEPNADRIVALKSKQRLGPSSLTYVVAIQTAPSIALISISGLHRPGKSSSALLEYRHLSLKSIGMMASLPLVAGMVGDIVGGTLTDAIYRKTGTLKFSRRVVAAPAMLISSACLIPASMAHSAWPAILWCAALGIPHRS
jgi:hypothetical protein